MKIVVKIYLQESGTTKFLGVAPADLDLPVLRNPMDELAGFVCLQLGDLVLRISLMELYKFAQSLLVEDVREPGSLLKNLKLPKL